MLPPFRSRPSRVAAGCLALLLLAGRCGGERVEPSPAPSPLPTEPVAGAGTIRVAYPEEPSTLSPIEARSAASRDILRAVLPSFFVVTPDLEYRPSLLAEEPSVTARGDRMLVEFRIRDDARWSDGEPITVADVAFTWRVMTDPDLPVAVRDGFEHLRDVEEISPTEGRLVLDRFEGWRDLFSAGRWVLPAHAVSELAEVASWRDGPPVSGGPFTVGRWVPGRSITLTRSASFTPPALVRRIEVVFVPDPTTAIQLIERGEVDVAAPALGVSWGRRLAEAGAGVSGAFGPDLVTLVLNVAHVSLEERRAIADGIDRSRFVDVLLPGEARRADGILAPEQPGAEPAWAGDGGGTPPSPGVEGELDLVYADTEVLTFLARFVREEMARVGVDVELVGLESGLFNERWLPERRFDLALWEARGGPGPWLDRWFGSEGGEAVSGLQDARLDRLLSVAARGEAPALTGAQRRLASLAAVLPIFQPEVTVGFLPGIGGVVANPTVDGPFWNAGEWSKAE